MKTSVTGDRKEKEHFCDCSSIPCCNFPETERSFVWNRSRPVRAFLCNFYAAQTSFVWGTYLWATYPVSPLSSRKATKCFFTFQLYLHLSLLISLLCLQLLLFFHLKLCMYLHLYSVIVNTHLSCALKIKSVIFVPTPQHTPTLLRLIRSVAF